MTIGMPIPVISDALSTQILQLAGLPPLDAAASEDILTEPSGGCCEYRKKHVLVVEDSPSDVFLILQAIESRQIRADVEVVKDGAAAVTLIKKMESGEKEGCDPDLIMLDLNLPKLGGFEVLRRLRRSEKCADVPVIMMTSSQELSDREEALSTGANAFFSKPLEYAEFLQIGDVMRQFVG